MTYQEILNSILAKTVSTYESYLNAKIAGISDSDTFLADKTEQHRAEYERLEKKLIALLATIKKDDNLNEEAPENYEENFIA